MNQQIIHHDGRDFLVEWPDHRNPRITELTEQGNDWIGGLFLDPDTAAEVLALVEATERWRVA